MSITNAYLLDEQTIALVERDASGKRRVRRAPAAWSAYFDTRKLPANFEQANRSLPEVKAMRREGDWLRVDFSHAHARASVCTRPDGFCRQLGIPSYEADISPITRWLIDSKTVLARPRRVYLDIETDSRVPIREHEKMRVLCWALVDDHGRAQIGVLAEDDDRSERALLDALWRALEPYDQVIAWHGAWDGTTFDFDVIWKRSQQRGCRVDARQWLWIDHLVTFRRMNMQVAESGAEKQSFKLGDIAERVVGEGKTPTPERVAARFGNKSMGALSWPLWEAGGEWREMLVRYMLQDAMLLPRIEKETGYLDLFATICEISSVVGNTEGLNPTQQMDGFMLTLGMERGYHFPTQRYREAAPYEGAYVMKPKYTGISKNVHVADFASLYPSIMRTWNMSPETKLGRLPIGSKQGPWEIPHCVSPLTGIAFRTDVLGILPYALGHMIAQRKFWSDKQTEYAPGTPEWHDCKRRSNAFKVEANSFYGVAGSPYSRFYDREIAESVTKNGVWLIKQTIAAAEAWEAAA